MTISGTGCKPKKMSLIDRKHIVSRSIRLQIMKTSSYFPGKVAIASLKALADRAITPSSTQKASRK